MAEPSDDNVETKPGNQIQPNPKFARREAEIRRDEEVRRRIRKELDEEEGKNKSLSWRERLSETSVLTTILTAIVIPLVVWLIGQIGVAWKEADMEAAQAKAKAEAERARILADRRADVSQMTPLIPHFARSGDDRVRLVALRVLGALREARDDDPAIRRVYQAAEQEAAELAASSDPAEREEGRRIREALAAPTSSVRVVAPPPTGTPITPVIVQAPTARPAQVYIHIYDENQRVAATALRDRLSSQNVVVPGIENVVRTRGDNMRRFAQRGAVGIRYYRSDDRPAALFTAGIVQNAQGGAVAARLQDLSARGYSVRPGMVEVWFPCGPQQGCAPPAPPPAPSPGPAAR